MSGRRAAGANGAAAFAAPADADADARGRAAAHQAVFTGHLKTRTPSAYEIPLLVPRTLLVRAQRRLRALPGGDDVGSLDHRAVSSKYQSRLREALRADPVLRELAPTVHALRALYACIALRMFDFGDSTLERPSAVSWPRAAARRRQVIRYDVEWREPKLAFPSED